MSEGYHPVTIDEARVMAQWHQFEQVVIWSFCTGHGQHVTTWGKPLRHSALAAEAGNHIKRAAGWPENLAQDLPGSLQLLFSNWDEAVAGEVVSGRLEKGAALVMFTALRDAVRGLDPDLAEHFIPKQTEAVQLT